MNWMDLTLSEFQSHLASDDATPGGGTAAAIALGQAAALTEMVAGLTLAKENGNRDGLRLKPQGR